MKQLDLFRREPPPHRPQPSDPELWRALFSGDVEALLDQRHGDDAAAKLAEIRQFHPPSIYQLTKEQAAIPWAGHLNALQWRLERELEATP